MLVEEKDLDNINNRVTSIKVIKCDDYNDLLDKVILKKSIKTLDLSECIGFIEDIIIIELEDIIYKIIDSKTSKITHLIISNIDKSVKSDELDKVISYADKNGLYLEIIPTNYSNSNLKHDLN